MDTEVEAYGFIRDQLRALGWNVKDPSRHPDGEVWTQNQCLAHPEIKARLGTKRPENMVKLSESEVWVIEAKSSRSQIEVALSEAIDYYAAKINEGRAQLRAVLATGVAGNEGTGYLVKTKVRLDGTWKTVTINGQEATGLLYRKDTKTLLESRIADIRDFTPSQRVFLETAERINGILHMGGINKNDRAKVMAALLLSVVEGPNPNIDADLPVLIEEINARTKYVLRKNGKEEFSPFVEILPPTNISNHVKFKQALVLTIQALRNLNIKSAMNSATDVLGQFYEVFLKYGNGAKEIGIILTPRHVTRFAADALGLHTRDIVLDPACGTGGFLVAAYDYARRAYPNDIERFRKNNLFGVEQESTVAVLAIVNMIFRGDGKNNIIEGDCFKTFLVARASDGHPSAEFVHERPPSGSEAVTRVLMNPPFALRSSKEKEYHFVSQALTTMADGGLLFSLLPMNAMFGETGEKMWRTNDLLGKHTLLAVISFPDDLFYPSAMKQVLGIVVKKGTPHPRDQAVLWVCVRHDGHVKVKKRRLPASEFIPPKKEENQLPQILPYLQAFIASPTTANFNVPELCKTAPIDFTDPLLELVPEAYVDSRVPSSQDLERGIDELTRETAAFLIRFRREQRTEEYDDDR